MAAKRLCRVEPVVARSATRRCPTRDQSSRDLSRCRASSTRRCPTLYPSSGVAYPSSPVSFFSSRTRRLALRTHCLELSTRHRTGRTRRREVRDPSSRSFPRPPRTCPRAPYKYVRVSLFPRTLSEHPGLHLPRRLLAGFSKGCFIFFIVRHPPRLEFREHSAVKSALIILNYLEIKHCFFFSLGILALE